LAHFPTAATRRTGDRPAPAEDGTKKGGSEGQPFALCGAGERYEGLERRGRSEAIVTNAAYRLNVCFSQLARTSLRQIAAELNAGGHRMARGRKWHATTVRNILKMEDVGLPCL